MRKSNMNDHEAAARPRAPSQSVAITRSLSLSIACIGQHRPCLLKTCFFIVLILWLLWAPRNEATHPWPPLHNASATLTWAFPQHF